MIQSLCLILTSEIKYPFYTGDPWVVRRSRASLEGPAYPSGSLLSLFQCSVVCNGEHFGVLNL